MTPTAFVGIDPGRTGAIGVVTSGKTAKVWDMPPHGEERGIDVAAFNDILDQIGTEGVAVALEWNSGRPGEVPDFAYRFGLQTGQIDGLLWARGFNVLRLSSVAWTRKFGFPGKAYSNAVEQRAKAWDQSYPPYKNLIRGPRGGLLDGRIDALFIAEYLRLAKGTVCGLRGGKAPAVYRGLPDWMLKKTGKENEELFRRLAKE